MQEYLFLVEKTVFYYQKNEEELQQQNKSHYKWEKEGRLKFSWCVSFQICFWGSVHIYNDPGTMTGDP